VPIKIVVLYPPFPEQGGCYGKKICTQKAAAK